MWEASTDKGDSSSRGEEKEGAIQSKCNKNVCPRVSKEGSPSNEANKTRAKEGDVGGVGVANLADCIEPIFIGGVGGTLFVVSNGTGCVPSLVRVRVRSRNGLVGNRFNNIVVIYRFFGHDLRIFCLKCRVIIARFLLYLFLGNVGSPATSAAARPNVIFLL